MDALFRKFKELLRKLLRKPRYRKILEGEIRLTGKLVAHKLPPSLQANTNNNVAISEKSTIYGSSNETEGVRIAYSEGQSVAADTNVNGTINFSIKGKSRQGEAGTIDVCSILVERLNQDGANWNRPIDLNTIKERKEQGVDCEAYDGDFVLNIQVTRVEHSIWRNLSKNGEALKSTDAQELTEAIMSAIIMKSRKIARDQRKELILALDAIETPNYAFESVINIFRKAHQDEVAELGFRGVWLVGSTVTLTHRLD